MFRAFWLEGEILELEKGNSHGRERGEEGGAKRRGSALQEEECCDQRFVVLFARMNN